MLILKILGCVLVLAAGTVAAGTAVRYEKRKLSVLEAWIDLIRYIRGQIDCYLMPLDEILAGTDRELLVGCMCTAPHPDLPFLLHASSVYLDADAKRLLSAFVREIGGSYREEQLRRCDYYLTALRELREKLSAELPARLRLSVALCLCAAVGTAILFW